MFSQQVRVYDQSSLTNENSFNNDLMFLNHGHCSDLHLMKAVLVVAVQDIENDCIKIFTKIKEQIQKILEALATHISNFDDVLARSIF